MIPCLEADDEGSDHEPDLWPNDHDDDMNRLNHNSVPEIASNMRTGDTAIPSDLGTLSTGPVQPKLAMYVYQNLFRLHV